MKGTSDYDPKNPRCDQEQLDMLKYCSDDNDLTSWNKWRNSNYYYDEDYGLFFYGDDDGKNEEEVWLQCADLQNANLYNRDKSQSVNLVEAHLENTNFSYATLYKAQLSYSYLNYSDLYRADLKGANLHYAQLQNADLSEAFLTNASFYHAHLEKTIFINAFIEGTEIRGAHLEGADFTGAIVNGKTKIQDCFIDEKTNFSSVGLDLAQIEPKLLSALKTNVRRFEWGKYYKRTEKFPFGAIKTFPMRFFWWLSDYGSSSIRIALSMLIAILFFTDMYLALGKFVPGVFSVPDPKAELLVGIPFHDYIRILCFAISTMVTLGFGGMNITADPEHMWFSSIAFLLVTFNLLSGYLFLSVLVTRIGILFQSLGPEQVSKKINNTAVCYVTMVLFALGIDIAIFNYGIIHCFAINLILVILNVLAIYFFSYLIFLSLKTMLLFFKKK
jgi:uncharacterized protein YjbI with pentapeptide repeats